MDNIKSGALLVLVIGFIGLWLALYIFRGARSEETRKYIQEQTQKIICKEAFYKDFPQYDKGLIKDSGDNGHYDCSVIVGTLQEGWIKDNTEVPNRVLFDGSNGKIIRFNLRD